jgi:outer membrane protein OmpA-like peptidoglycan-associated protein
MKASTAAGPLVLCGILGMSLFTGGCLATRKHVRNTIEPVQQQVNDVNKKTEQNTASIGDLDRNVAKVNEATMEADKKAVAAGQAAERANQAANQAQTAANSANTLAQQGLARADQVQKNLDNVVQNMDNYKLASTEKVYFRVNRSELTSEEKAKLDQAIQGVQNMKNYVIEVAGYTDKTGSKAANLELSRRRAEAVVRYLTVEHNVPLRRIHDLGAGSEFPNADNTTRAARKENRRVDIRIFTLETPGGSQSGSLSPSSTATPTNQ